MIYPFCALWDPLVAGPTSEATDPAERPLLAWKTKHLDYAHQEELLWLTAELEVGLAHNQKLAPGDPTDGAIGVPLPLHPSSARVAGGRARSGHWHVEHLSRLGQCLMTTAGFGLADDPAREARYGERAPCWGSWGHGWKLDFEEDRG